MEPNGLLCLTHDVISTVTEFIPPPERSALRTAARALLTQVPVSGLRVLLPGGPGLGGAWVSITRDTPVHTIVFVDDCGRGAHLLDALTMVLPMPQRAQYHTKDRDAAIRVARRFKGRPAAGDPARWRIEVVLDGPRPWSWWAPNLRIRTLSVSVDHWKQRVAKLEGVLRHFRPIEVHADVYWDDDGKLVAMLLRAADAGVVGRVTIRTRARVFRGAWIDCTRGHEFV